MVKKLTNDEFIAKVLLVHGTKYTYNDPYIKASQHINILCAHHGLFKQTPNKHLAGRNCPKCADVNRSVNQPTKSNTLEFISKVIKVHKDRYDYSAVNYVNNNTNIIIICKLHGEFSQLPSNHLKGENCTYCGIEARADSIRWTLEYFKLQAEKIHMDTYEYSNYINYNVPIAIKCKIHKLDFKQRPGDHLRGQGCPKCGIIKMSMTQSLGWDKFIEFAKEVHGDKYEYTVAEYKNTEQKIDIYCIKCKRTFKQKINPHIYAKQGCPYCCQFKSEKLTRAILEEITGLTFKKVRPKWLNKLELDGYNESNGLGFEYNGKQHYEYVKYYHKSVENFIKQQERDSIKRKICNRMAINLITIPYQYDYRNYGDKKSGI
jgi:hypothetical protein